MNVNRQANRCTMEKKDKIRFFDSLAPKLDVYKSRNKYYNQDIETFLKTIIPPNRKILEIGSATGNLLNSLEPSYGVGVDISPKMISIAREKFKHLKFESMDAENLRLNTKFDYIVMSDLIGNLSDVWQSFRELHKVCDENTKVVITYYNYLWQPLLKIAEVMGLKTPLKEQNWLFVQDIENLLYLNNFKVIRSGHRILIPKYIPLVSTFLNKFLAKLPLIRRLCMVQYIIARKEMKILKLGNHTVTILMPCRNEKGNIEEGVRRIPKFGMHQEIIFVDGNSTDGTVNEIKKVMRKYRGKDIKFIPQGNGKGKGDAVRKGFLKASGDILMILDADLTVPPEDLPKFYLTLVEGKAQFANGSRLVYPMEKEAMRYLNLFGNWMFGKAFSWIMEQRVRDTLCGTKVLFRKDYMVLKEYRQYFNNMDPFGDFDLLFGASKMNLDIAEIPIGYRERKYGETKLRRFRHGRVLIKMCWLGIRKLKFN